MMRRVKSRYHFQPIVKSKSSFYYIGISFIGGIVLGIGLFYGLFIEGEKPMKESIRETRVVRELTEGVIVEI